MLYQTISTENHIRKFKNKKKIIIFNVIAEFIQALKYKIWSTGESVLEHIKPTHWLT